MLKENLKKEINFVENWNSSRNSLDWRKIEHLSTCDGTRIKLWNPNSAGRCHTDASPLQVGYPPGGVW